MNTRRDQGPMEARTVRSNRLPASPWRRRFLFQGLGGGLGLPGLLGLAACQPVPLAPLKLGVHAWVGSDPLVLARERGLLDTRAVKVVELPSMADSLRHFRNRLLDAAVISLGDVLRMAAEGAAPRIVAVLSESTGADVVMARPALRDRRQLQGAAVAVESTTEGALMLRRLLQAAEVDPGLVQRVQVDASLHPGLLREGRVDAAVLYEPLASPLKDEGFVPIFDSRQMPGELLDVLVVHAEVLQQRPQQVQSLLAGWSQGMSLLQRHPGESARLLASGAYGTAAAYLSTFEGVRFFQSGQSLSLLSGRPLELGQRAERLVLTLMNLGLLTDTPDWGLLIEAGPARQAQNAGGGA